jgi:integrase
LNGTPKPERFWLILIALFHGFRLGNIVALTKKDVVLSDKGTWLFQLREGKTLATIRPVAIDERLLLLGFLEWVDGLNREKLFQDSSDTFSKFYNRSEPARCVYGFEHRYVTQDVKKCLYSLRHSFAGNVFEQSSDLKITADLMGHALGSVTNRYTKLTRAEQLKTITNKFDLAGVDLDKLDDRAKELFFTEYV